MGRFESVVFKKINIKREIKNKTQTHKKKNNLLKAINTHPVIKCNKNDNYCEIISSTFL